MPHQTIKGKGFVWYHFSEMGESDFRFLQDNFKFHPLDFDDLREVTELSKVDVYKDYIFSVFNIPHLDVVNNKVEKKNLAIFIGKNFFITATRESISPVDRFFARANRSKGLQKDAMSQTSGYFLYKLLDYIFRDSKVVLQELARETHELEAFVYNESNGVATKRLGMLRSNILFFGHVIDPQRLLIPHFINARKTYIPKGIEMYFDDIKDMLDGIWVVTNNLKNMVDSLFSVNEAFLTHKTNSIIRVLTLISVVLMPPTLITSYYGMNVNDLPFANDALIVSMIVILSLVGFFFVVAYLDKRR